ncbi:mitochondrial inner-membrane-bound regulator-domain-containing protein [Gilbertella persicaria]|uniref:mitochondrial inner-membrane-bound regulator-domain-containing protein n=1 Tax=Gilbertella persicaria TaxID=101096 RepID=UPI00221F663C|nr:mitochondrial inner-membrane-bound regulator-domain-containing protein [Gilbertella persicaria]KAI8047346.1 mitochondrial inner-membrane-bound regulator-domain-containing protein [Gilbertella persicaria]
MSFLSSRIRIQLIVSKRAIQPKLRCFSSSRPRLLSDEQLQEILSEIEKPLQRKSGSIGHTKSVLLESIETYRPKHNVISKKDMEKLRTQVSNSFTVRQLSDYLVAQQIPVKKGTRKDGLLTEIIQNQWNVTTKEQLRQAQMERQKNLVKETLVSSKQELFFIIGDNGNTIRSIEQKNDVNITIDIEKSEYVIEGLPEAVRQTKKDIQSRLKIQQEHIDLPVQVIHDSQLQSQVNQALPDISRLSRTFITIEDNKMVLASMSDEAMQDAKRLLNLFLTEINATDKQPLDKADHTVVHNNASYTLLPLYDSASIPFYDRGFYWKRLKNNTVDTQKNYQVLNGQNIGSFGQIKDVLLAPFDVLDNISLEASFGHLLFQYNGMDHQVDIAKLSTLYNNRTLFLNTMPPRQFTTPFMPLDKEFHQRVIQVDYVDQSLLSNNSPAASNNRLTLEFIMKEDGQMELKHIVGEKKRFVMHLLGIHGRVDIRLCAKQQVSLETLELQALIDQCKLLSYNELKAPASFEGFMLADVTFRSKKRYLVEDNLVSMDHIEQQDKGAKRTELLASRKKNEVIL